MVHVSSKTTHLCALLIRQEYAVLSRKSSGQWGRPSWRAQAATLNEKRSAKLSHPFQNAIFETTNWFLTLAKRFRKDDKMSNWSALAVLSAMAIVLLLRTEPADAKSKFLCLFFLVLERRLFQKMLRT